jgi:hypothetical protein
MRSGSPLSRLRSVGLVLSFAFALLTFGEAFGDLVITEIHYAPADPDGTQRPELEFVEVHNDGPEPYDLAGYTFVSGIAYTFDRYYLPGRDAIVVCRDAAAVRAEYGLTATDAVGNFVGVLDNSGEEVALANPQGIVVARVSYNDRNRWPAGAKGTGHSLSLRYEYVDPSEPENWTISAQMGGTPAAPNFGGQINFTEEPIIAVGEVWKYFKGNVAHPTNWQTPGFSDAGWLEGPTGIGYGDNDDATILTDMLNGYLTVLLRKTFTIPDVDALDTVVLNVGIDDGFVAYVNGTCVGAVYSTCGAAGIAATATVGDLPEFHDLTIPKALLVDGPNLIAISGHNVTLGSSDVSVIPKLVNRSIIDPGSTATIPVVVNEGFLRTGGTRFIELYNTSSASVDLSGFHLTDDFADLDKYTIADSTMLPGKGFLSFTEAQLGFDLSIVPVTKERVSMALVNAAGTRVVDAAIFEPKVDEGSEARFPDGGSRWAPAADPTPGARNAVTPASSDVVFNEIMYQPISLDDNDEYIELYNRGVTLVDLSGWEVEGVGGFVFPPATTIAAGDYLVIAKNPARITQKYGSLGSRLVGTGWTGSIRDGGERLSLLDLDKNEADFVRFYDGGNDWTRWPNGGGPSLELIDPDSDNSAGISWDASDDRSKVTPQLITYTNVPWGGRESDLGIMIADEGITVVDDVSLIRVGGGSELVVNGTFDANASPWRFEGTHIRSGRTASAQERITGAGSLKLIAWNGGGDYKVNRVEEDTSTQTSGNYTVSYRARWVVGANRIITIGDYSTGQPNNPGLAGSNLLAVPDNLGTPGAVNSVTQRQIAQFGSRNVGPAIDRVTMTPGVPEGNEDVLVRAHIRDVHGVSAAEVLYRTESPSGAFTTVAMTDPDGDGIYAATIPGQAQGTKMVFYVTARDGMSRTSRYPFDPVTGTYPPVVDPATARPSDHSYIVYRHDVRTVATSRHSLRFILHEDDESELRTRLSLSNQMLEGTMIFGSGGPDDIYHGAKIRFAGSPWLRGGNNDFGKSYSIKSPKDKLLHGRRENFNLDEHATDGRERLSHYLLRQSAGSTRLPYWDFHSLVSFQLNDVHNATKELLAKPDGNYVEDWFDGDLGPFFEMDDRFQFNDSPQGHQGNAQGNVLFPPYGASTGGPNKENYRWYFVPRGGKNKQVDDYDPFLRMCLIYDDRVTPNSTFDNPAHPDSIWNLADVEEILRVWAIELNIDDWDTWCGTRGKNCYHYQWPVDGLWRLAPWDLELTYGSTTAFSMPASITQTYGNGFREITRMINRPRIKRMYYGILAEQVDTTNGVGFFHSGFLASWAASQSAAGVGSINVGFIDTRANLIRGWIASAVYPQVRLTITTNGGNDFVAGQPTVSLQGTAPADIFFLTVLRNGTPIDEDLLDVSFSTSDLTGWTIAGIPLVGGVNNLQVVGFGSRGNIVDTDTIAATSSIDWDPPVITGITPSAAAPEDTIVIEGTDFHDGLDVFFGGVEATGVTFDEDTNPTEITVIVPNVPPGATSVTVRNVDAQVSNAFAYEVQPAPPKFLRGDANMDTLLDVGDGLRILRNLYDGLAVDCLDALDANDSGVIEMVDATIVLNHIFLSGPAPAAPYPVIAADPTRSDPIDCALGISGS